MERRRMTAARRTMGVDPGTARLGCAVIEKSGSDLKLLTCSALITSPKLPMHERLARLYDELSEAVRAYQPTEMAIEELFFAKNVTTAVSVGQARGVALLVAAQAGLSVAEYKPMQVKQAVHGYGLATKEQVGEMVRVLLRLKDVPRPDDAADAAAIAICHLNTLRFDL
jgi:crossover junction endodeoxyribonuclease RuvC